MTSDHLLIPAECRHPVQLECRIAVWIWRVVPVVLCVISACGNTTCIIVLARKKLRANSACIYLLCLAVIDMSLIFLSLSRNVPLRGYGFDIRNTSTVVCKVHTWILHVLTGCSGWLLVVVTMERVIVIVWPIFAREKMTQRKAIFVCRILLVIIIAANAHLLYDFDLIESQAAPEIGNGTAFVNHTVHVCIGARHSIISRPVRKWLDVTIFNALPAIFIIIGNAIIAKSLLKQVKRRLEMQQGSQTASTVAKKQSDLAKVLLVICAFSLLTTLPKSIYAVVNSTTGLSRNPDGVVVARVQLAHAILACLFYCNFTFNFLIYISRGPLFREEFRQICKNLIKN